MSHVANLGVIVKGTFGSSFRVFFGSRWGNFWALVLEKLILGGEKSEVG